MALPKLTKDEAVELALAIRETFEKLMWGEDEDGPEFCCTSDAVDGAVDCIKPAVLAVLGHKEVRDE